MDYEFYMDSAIELARKAAAIGEVPIGCVIVYEGEIIGSAYNMRNTRKNTLCHAEILAINEASAHMNDWRLEECTIFVTLEPCPMCAGAILTSRMKRAVFGTRNPKAGSCGSLLNILQANGFNHSVEIIEGVRREECSGLLTRFFKELRVSTLRTTE